MRRNSQGISGVAGTVVVKRTQEEWDTDLDINICFVISILHNFEKIWPAAQAQTAQGKWHLGMYVEA